MIWGWVALVCLQALLAMHLAAIVLHGAYKLTCSSPQPAFAPGGVWFGRFFMAAVCLNVTASLAASLAAGAWFSGVCVCVIVILAAYCVRRFVHFRARRSAE